VNAPTRPEPEATRDLAASHLLYEIAMLAEMTARLGRFRQILTASTEPEGASELLSLAGRNADIESFALHARVLVEFLYGDLRRGRRAIAADFFDDDDIWARVRPDKTRLVAEVFGRVSEEVGHLSYRRVDPAKEWHYETLWREIALVLGVFVDNADVDRLGSGFVENVEILIRPQPFAVALGSFEQRRDEGATSTATIVTPGTATSMPRFASQASD
jgi:hypothetical protein